MSAPVTTSLRIEAFGREYFCYRPALYSHMRDLLNVLNLNLNADTVVFSFQSTPDFSDVSKLLVSVQSLSVDSDSNPECNIDLDMMQVIDINHPSDPRQILSVEGLDAAVELRRHAKEILKRVQDYRDRLIEHGIITDSSPFLQVDLLTCPLCRRRLESCADCESVVACTDRSCPASPVTEGHWCNDRPTKFSCRRCLDIKGLDASVVQCPTCQLWRRSDELDWCFGRIISPSRSTKELANLSDSDLQSIERSHPRKPGPCTFCVQAGNASNWQECDGNPRVCPVNFRTPSGLQRKYCPECTAEVQGCWCVCGLVWTCDVCTQDHDYALSLYTTCPRCRRTYCLDYAGCDYCQICQTCRKPRLCDDCFEEDTFTEDATPAVTFAERCGRCSGPICDSCSRSTLKCHFCRDRVCGGCTSPRHCFKCEVPICTRCSEYQSQRPWYTYPCPPKSGEEEVESDETDEDDRASMTS